MRLANTGKDPLEYRLTPIPLFSRVLHNHPGVRDGMLLRAEPVKNQVKDGGMGRKRNRGALRHTLQGVLISAAVWAAACSGGEEPLEESAGGEAVPVKTVGVQSTTFLETVRGVGSVEAAESVEIRPEIAGLVKKAVAEEGMAVREGDLLFRLEDDTLRQGLDEQKRALDAAQARLENARSNYRRLESLWQRKVIAKDRWDQAQTELEVARAEVKRLRASVERAREQIEDTRIRAPFAGVLSERLVDPGDLVQPGQALVTLYRDQGREAVFKAPGLYAGVIEPDQPVEVEVGAFPDRTFTGRVFFVSPELDPTTRSFQVKAAVDDPENLLKPGMFARIRVIVSRRENRPAVPEEALVALRTGYAVFVVEDGRAHRRPVRIGLRRVGTVEIVDGLEPGETVVRKGHLQLKEGDSVREIAGENGGEGSP
jgi:membrane fusion protein (multidrug efflux system)